MRGPKKVANIFLKNRTTNIGNSSQIMNHHFRLFQSKKGSKKDLTFQKLRYLEEGKLSHSWAKPLYKGLIRQIGYLVIGQFGYFKVTESEEISGYSKAAQMAIFEHFSKHRVHQNSPKWGDSHMEQTGMLVENFEFNP